MPTPRYDYDPEADALYVHLAALPYAHGHDLDAERRVDYAADGTPIGVELTCVRSGVALSGLPAAEQAAAVLADIGVPVLRTLTMRHVARG